MRTLNTYIFAATMLAALPAFAEDGHYTPPGIMQQGNITYITGGIGEGEAAALQATRSNYNLQIMNADKTGHFVGETYIVISDSKHQEVLNVDAAPVLYANLPYGRYTVEATSEQGEFKKKAFAIVKGKPTLVHFSWLQDNSDNHPPHSGTPYCKEGLC